jgi:hypothetical protein
LLPVARIHLSTRTQDKNKVGAENLGNGWCSTFQARLLTQNPPLWIYKPVWPEYWNGEKNVPAALAPRRRTSKRINWCKFFSATS